MNVQELLKLNVNEHTEKKSNLTYLSWAWAWAEALKADPQASFAVQMFGDKCYMEINGTAMVWVTVTMFGKPMVCQLPVMDNTNKPITIEGTTTVNKYGKEITTKLDSFNVNTAIMRCMTKALSLHGLGLYIYAGDDLPQGDEPESTIEADTMTDLFKAIEAATTQDELKLAYKIAYAACDSDKAWQLKVIAAKDKAKGKL
jgi:hypothetical protein